MGKNPQFENFDATIEKPLTVPHSEIKAKLDAERAAQKRKPKEDPQKSTRRFAARFDGFRKWVHSASNERRPSLILCEKNFG